MDDLAADTSMEKSLVETPPAKIIKAIADEQSPKSKRNFCDQFTYRGMGASFAASVCSHVVHGSCKRQAGGG